MGGPTTWSRDRERDRPSEITMTGTRIGLISSSMTSFLPGNSKRTRPYEAGMPISIDTIVVMTAPFRLCRIDAIHGVDEKSWPKRSRLQTRGGKDSSPDPPKEIGITISVGTKMNA